MVKTLIYFDKYDPKTSVDLLGAADELNKYTRYESYALCINHTFDEIITEFDYLLKIDDERIEPFDTINITNAIEELNAINDFDSILFPATPFGRSIAPRAAMRLKTGLTADVTAIKNDGGGILLIRPAFDGNILAGVANKNVRPLMASIRPNVFRYERRGLKKAKTVTHIISSFTEPRVELIETRNKEHSKDIRESRVLVSGGGGTAGSFEKLRSLAGSLNGMVSASRRIVDNGIAPRAIQVGQSGKTVSPDLYIALGIHGSFQHIEGLKNVKYIIAVNKNSSAPICSLADIVVEGDAFEFIEKLNERIALK